jgi:hypothetical protein
MDLAVKREGKSTRLRNCLDYKLSAWVTKMEGYRLDAAPLPLAAATTARNDNRQQALARLSGPFALLGARRPRTDV